MKLVREFFIQKNNSKPVLISIYLLIKFLGTLFALYVFGKYTPLYDSLNFIQNGYAEDQHLRVKIIQVITKFLVDFTHSKFLPHLFFSIFSGLGLLIFSLLTKRITPLLLLLLPSSLVWTSIVSKEAIFFLFFSLILIAWWKIIIRQVKLLDWLLIGISLLVCMLLRPHYSLALCWLLTSAVILCYEIKRKKIILAVLFIIFISAMKYLWPDLVVRGYGAIWKLARASRFDTLQINSIDDFMDYIGTGFIFGIIGPLPSELIKRPEFIPFFLEGVAILLTPLLMLKIILKNQKTKALLLENYLVGLFPAILMVMLLHSPFGVTNPGSAVRWRVNFELIFYFAPLLLYWESRKNV